MSPVARDRGVLVGMMSLEDDARVDFARLRAERRAKVLSGMESHDLDALMLGGVGNVRYASGARQLGRSGVLPFAPVAVAVRDTDGCICFRRGTRVCRRRSAATICTG
jgi:hypothetical protein